MMTTKPAPYAKGTKITEEATLRQIKDRLRRVGAEGFGNVDRGSVAVIQFELAARTYRFELPLPLFSEFERDAARRLRRPPQQVSAWQDEVNRRWRALLDVIEGRLRSVTEGIMTMERAFALEAVMPSGETVADIILPQLERASRGGQAPRLLPPDQKERG